MTITKIRLKRMKKRIFDKTIAWMNGEITMYQVAKYAKCNPMSAKRWLNIFKAEIEKQKVLIPEKVIESLEVKKGYSTWKKLRNLIVKVALKQKASSTN